MHGEVVSVHRLDKDGMPAGGTTTGRGFKITWQKGPLVDPVTGDRLEPSGAFVEDLIAAVESRIEFYQTTSLGRFNCEENAAALRHLRHASAWLDARTRTREAKGIEGTHVPH